MQENKNIRQYNKTELKDLFVSMGEKGFRGNQVHEWLWQKNAGSFDKMSDLPQKMRDWLSSNFEINKLSISQSQISKDGTIKNAFRLYDDNIVEGVLIPTKSRTTACISSQVGCSLACEFCATGRLARVRNLNTDEIYDQVVAIKNQAKDKYERNLSNIVYMGMGEPLLNYNNVLKSIEMVTSEDGLAMSPRRITVSTAGISKMIKKLGDDKVKFNLALSLHAANDEKRNKIMPINESNTLETLAEALIYFHASTNTRVTFEYIIFKDFNDTIIDADELAKFCKNVPCKVNIIEYNPIDDGKFQQASPEKVNAFAAYLERRNIIVNIRRSRGKDIDAACGQLANKN